MARKRCPPEGTRVRFTPNPVSMMLYSASARRQLPPAGTEGSVTSLPIGGGRSTCMPGPGGGLVYVDWDEGGTIGTSRYDLEWIDKKGKSHSLGGARAEELVEKARDYSDGELRRQWAFWKDRPYGVNRVAHQTLRAEMKRRGLKLGVDGVGFHNKRGGTFAGLLGNPRTTLINTPDDMKWLRDVHLKNLSAKYKSAVIYGNEDYPERIDVYVKQDPDQSDDPVEFVSDNRGGYKKGRWR